MDLLKSSPAARLIGGERPDGDMSTHQVDMIARQPPLRGGDD